MLTKINELKILFGNNKFNMYDCKYITLYIIKKTYFVNNKINVHYISLSNFWVSKHLYFINFFYLFYSSNFLLSLI